MYKMIEISTTKNDYFVEIINFNEPAVKTTCRVWLELTATTCRPLTTFNGTFNTVKKLLNNYVKTELKGKITEIKEY